MKSNKVDIASDIVSNVFLKEIRGISLEVREWSSIIKTAITDQHKKYLDDVAKEKESRLAVKKITKDDLRDMSQKDVNNILKIISKFYRLKEDQIKKLSVEEIINRYNQAIESDALVKLHKQNLPSDIKPPTQIIINGKDYPEAYKNFAVDKWVIIDQKPTEYDHVNSGYDPSGQYIVYINLDISSNITGFILVHEIKHAYQDWQRQSKNKPSIAQSKEVRELYTKDFEKYVLSHSRAGFELRTIESVISGYYISSEFEIAAYLESVYDAMHSDDAYEKSTSVQFEKALRDTAHNMLNFDPLQVSPKVKPEQLQNEWTNIITDYDIPMFRKFKNVFDFLKYTEKVFKKRGKYIISKIDKIKTLNTIE
jgi:hypothetical protein